MIKKVCYSYDSYQGNYLPLYVQGSFETECDNPKKIIKLAQREVGKKKLESVWIVGGGYLMKHREPIAT